MESPEARYDQLVDRVEVLYDEGLPRVALDLMDTADPDLDPWAAELAHLRACLLGSLGETAEALAVLQQASDAGGWWEAGILTEDDDLVGLQALPAFQELVAISRTRRTTAQDPPQIQLPSSSIEGVVVALHGAGQRASHAMRDWAPVLDLGYALVGVESSQLMSPRYRTWPDAEIAREDVGRALAQLPEELRGLPLIAAGFSAGGRVALNWALTGQPERAAGVVVLAPALRALPAEAQVSLSPATILIGTEDDLLEVVDEAAAQLTAFGLTIHRLPALGHEIPADLTDHLRALLPGIDG